MGTPMFMADELLHKDPETNYWDIASRFFAWVQSQGNEAVCSKVDLEALFGEHPTEIQKTFCEMLNKKMEANAVSKELSLEIQSAIQEVQESSKEQSQIDSADTENQGIFM